MQSTSIQRKDSTQIYIDCSGRIESSLVGDGVAEFQRICRVPVKVAVVYVHRLNGGEAIARRNAVAE